VIAKCGITALSLSRGSIYADSLVGIWVALIEILIEVTTEMKLE